LNRIGRVMLAYPEVTIDVAACKIKFSRFQDISLHTEHPIERRIGKTKMAINTTIPDLNPLFKLIAGHFILVTGEIDEADKYSGFKFTSGAL